MQPPASSFSQPCQRAFFYGAAAGLSPALQRLAQGLSQHGLTCHCRGAAAAGAPPPAEEISPDDCDVVILDRSSLRSASQPFPAFPSYLFHAQRPYATVYLETEAGPESVWGFELQFDLVLTTRLRGDRPQPQTVYPLSATTPEAMAQALLTAWQQGLPVAHRRRWDRPRPPLAPRPEGWGPLNLLLCPDWAQPEPALQADLTMVLRHLVAHPDNQVMTLLVESSAIGSEAAELRLSAVAMELLLREDLGDSAATLLPFEAIADGAALLPHLHLGLRLAQDARPPDLPLPTVSLADFATLRAAQIWQRAGDRLAASGQWQAAAREYRQALAVQPEGSVYWSLSECYRNLQQPHKLLAALEANLALTPQAAHLHFQLIFEAQHRGELAAAIAQAEAAIAHCPRDYTFRILYHLLMPLIYERVEDIAIYKERFQSGLQTLIEGTPLTTAAEQHQALAGISRVTNFYRAYQADNVREVQQTYGQFISRITAAVFPLWAQPLPRPKLAPGEKIRIGYASAYLHAYSGTLWLTGWLKYADRQQFEIYCYYTGSTPDAITQVFRDHCDVFHPLTSDLVATAQQIRSDNLHILIFPELGMDAPTFTVASLRLAPVQCTAWGHPVTTGLPTIDYFLSSELMEPEQAQEHYTETLVRLPNIGVAYPKPLIPPLTKTRADYGLPEAAVLYLCCQAPFKYLPHHDDLFPAIAQQIPQAKFIWFRATLLEQRLIQAFAAVGLNYQDYCLFFTVPERQDYLALNQLADIYLDTLDWSGGNTSLEAIACGLPIVTCPGEFMRGRHTDSFLKMIGVTETIARDEADYLQIALRLGRDPDWRQVIRRRMQDQGDRLYDDRGCVRGLEAFYRSVVTPTDEA